MVDVTHARTSGESIGSWSNEIKVCISTNVTGMEASVTANKSST